ncbi:MAG: hypothetical protein IJ151_04875 [Bacteroidales bacterium]|nr:hypothetical protein [Bacteroidales bacterium]
MKKFFILFIAVYYFVSCSKENDNQVGVSNNGLSTKTLFSVEELMAEDFIVREPQIQKYVQFKESGEHNKENNILY